MRPAAAGMLIVFIATVLRASRMNLCLRDQLILCGQSHEDIDVLVQFANQEDGMAKAW